MYKSILRTCAMVMVMAVTSLSLSTIGALADTKGYFIDLLYLQDGKTEQDAKRYFDKVVPIIAKHGLRRVTPGFKVTMKMSGDISPNLINVWSVGDVQNTMNDIFSDPKYLQHMPLRNSIFDMKRSHMFMMKAMQ
ncbi:MAG: hypothetical protein COA81_10310 [Alphaproteobacteria bacterium]|nr:MAG: hypothetical protein COA81_10310 [Alphaproteobacteria bacterium]